MLSPISERCAYRIERVRMQCEEAALMEKLQKSSVAALQKSKLAIEAVITKTVRQDQELNLKVKRVTSIKGIGPLTAVALMVYSQRLYSF